MKSAGNIWGITAQRGIYNKAAGKKRSVPWPGKRKAKEHRETVCGYDIIFFRVSISYGNGGQSFYEWQFSAFVLYEDSEQTDAICAAMA